MIKVTGSSDGFQEQVLKVFDNYLLEFNEGSIDLILLDTGEIRRLDFDRNWFKGKRRVRALKTFKKALNMIEKLEKEKPEEDAVI